MPTLNIQTETKKIGGKQIKRSIKMTRVLDLKEDQSTDILYDCIERVKSMKLKSLTVVGLQSYINNFEPIERFKILNRLTEISGNLKLKDFPYSVEELSNFIDLSNLVNLPVLQDPKTIFQYTPPDGYSKDERNKRAAQKRKQIAEFNEQNRIVRERIVMLKSQNLKEKVIEKILAEENIYSLNGKKLSQGSINRIYHNFMAMRGKFRSLDYNPGKADISDKPKGRKKYSNSLDLDTMGSGPVKRVNDVLTLVFHEGKIPRHEFYLCFVGQGRIVEEILHVNQHYLDGRNLSINIKEQTILSPGRYQVFVCKDPVEFAQSAIGKFTCDIFREYVEIENVRFVRDMFGKFLPSYLPPVEDENNYIVAQM